MPNIYCGMKKHKKKHCRTNRKMKYYLLKKKLYFPFSFRCIMTVTIPAIRSRLWETLNLSKCADSRGQKKSTLFEQEKKKEEKMCYLSRVTFCLSATLTITIDCPLLTSALCTAGCFPKNSNTQNGFCIAILATRSQSTVHAVPVAAGGDIVPSSRDRNKGTRKTNRHSKL